MSALLDQRVRLSRLARLRFDPMSNAYVLLSPERGLRLNASANEVLVRCNGQLTVRQIVHQIFNDLTRSAEPVGLTADQVRDEVLELIAALNHRHLLIVEDCS